MRARGDPATAVASARDIVKRLDAQLPLQRVRTLDAVLDEALAMRRFQIRLMATFGAAGLLLACLGIYGVLSGVVEGRRGELAIRLALGASRGRVRGLIVRQGLTPVASVSLPDSQAASPSPRSCRRCSSASHRGQPGVIGSRCGDRPRWWESQPASNPRFAPRAHLSSRRCAARNRRSLRYSGGGSPPLSGGGSPPSGGADNASGTAPFSSSRSARRATDTT